MANYNWRVTDGNFGAAASWANATTGQNPAATAPGAADDAQVVDTSGTVSGRGVLETLDTGASGAWTGAGQVSDSGLEVRSQSTQSCAKAVL